MEWIKARSLFYPTLCWNMLLGRWLKKRSWWDWIDPHVILGALPLAKDVPILAAEGVGAVVNTCEEYAGPLAEYEKFGIVQLYIPTIDFTHPEFDDVCRAVEFVDAQIAKGRTVYIHCKAGRGRSATVAICWLIKSRQITAEQAQAVLTESRPHVNQFLAERPVVQRFEKTHLKTAKNEQS